MFVDGKLVLCSPTNLCPVCENLLPEHYNFFYEAAVAEARKMKSPTKTPVGRDLNARVAEHVMGLNPKHFNRSQSYYEIQEGGIALKPCSTYIAAAWEVVGSIRKRGFVVSVDEGLNGELSACIVATKDGDKVTVVASETAETAPHAICLAALKAVGK